MQEDKVPYEAICRLVGRLFLETQYQNERLNTQYGTALMDLQQKLSLAESKIKELQGKKEQNGGIVPT